MILYISTDMEGSTGVVSPSQVDHREPLYGFGRAMQLSDLKAVVRAALNWGVDSIIVNDSHWTMTNLSYRDWEFPEEVELISGTPKLLGMVEGVSGADAAFFLGYHAMPGTEKAVLDHAYSSDVVFSLTVNGRQVGETGLNAMICGALGVPVAMVSGDYALCCEAESVLGPGVVTCCLKEGLGRFTAKTLPPEVTAELLAKSCEKALDAASAGKVACMEPARHNRMELTCFSTSQADAASLVPGTERISGRVLAVTAESVFELRRCLSSWIENAKSAAPF